MSAHPLGNGCTSPFLEFDLSIYRSIYVPTLTYGHELWVMTERIRSWIQAAEMSRVAGRSLRDRVRSSVIREELGGVPGMSHQEETPRETQDTLE